MEGFEGLVVNSPTQHKSGARDLFSILTGYVVSAVVIGVVVPRFLSSMPFLGKKSKQRGVPVEVGGEEGYAIRNAQASELIESPHRDATTVAALFEQSCNKHSQNRFLGTRKFIGREFVKASDGSKLEKLHLGDYEWQTYGQVFVRACNFASGLIKLGHDVDTRAAIFGDTRAEWFIAFQVAFNNLMYMPLIRVCVVVTDIVGFLLQGCFRQNITVVTIYSSLGEDALIHSLNEVGCKNTASPYFNI